MASAAMASSAFGATGYPTTPLGVPLWQEPLTYPFEALEPYMQARTVRRHYQEHHAEQVLRLQKTLDKAEITVGNVTSLMSTMRDLSYPPGADSRMPLGRLVSLGQSFQPPRTLNSRSVKAIRRAGGGHINHTAFWRFMRPPGTGLSAPEGRVADAIREDFGSIATFRQVFKETAMKCNGSGWAWLVYRPDGCLVATTTANEDNPLMKELIPWQKAGRPILALDLWEHSYCEQYQEDRERYIDAWWHLVNWEFVSRAYSIVTGKA